MSSHAKEIKSFRKKGVKKASAFARAYPGRSGNPPKHFQDATFLFIRSYEGDTGTRNPGLPEGIEHWLSPDIEVRDEMGPVGDRLQEGNTYFIDVSLHNEGDLSAYACTVELYICNPALGYPIGAPDTVLLGMQSAAVMSGTSTRVTFEFTAVPPNTGHKCLFARVHSLTHWELPAVPETLDPYHNRHDAQQNLFIVERGALMAFTMASAGSDETVLELRAAAAIPQKAKDLAAVRGLRLTQPSMQNPEQLFAVLPTGSADLFAPGAPVAALTPALVKKYRLQGALQFTNRMLKRTGPLVWRFSFRDKGVQPALLKVAHLAVKPGEGWVFDLTLTDKSRRVVGGITLIVK